MPTMLATIRSNSLSQSTNTAKWRAARSARVHAAGLLASHRCITAMTPLRPLWHVLLPPIVQQHAQLASRKLSCTAAMIHDSRRLLNTRTLCAWPTWYRHTHVRHSDSKYILLHVVAGARKSMTCTIPPPDIRGSRQRLGGENTQLQQATAAQQQNLSTHIP